MLSAKDNFISRIQSLRKTLSIDAVSQKSLTEKDHNEIAKLLRNGLAVVGFVTLEDFIKTRTSEIVSLIGAIGINFTDLPDKIQKAATVEALSAMQFQLRRIDNPSDKMIDIQAQAEKIASTANSNYEITPYAFMHNQSNISTDTVKQVLKCFNVIDPWKQMSELSSRLNLAALPLSNSYKNAADRRHKAAHDPTADTPQTDIMDFVKEAFSIAVTYDGLLSQAFIQIQSYHNHQSYLEGNKPLTAKTIKFRTIRYRDGKWKEHVEGAARAKRIGKTIDNNWIARAKDESKKNGQFFVQFDKIGLPCNWELF